MINTATDPAADRLINLRDAAARLSCTVRTLYNLARSDPGFPKLLKLGNGTRVRERELADYIARLGTAAAR